MRYEYSIRRSFVADHFHDLPGFQEARHGHNWEIQAAVSLSDPREEARLDAVLDAWVAGVDYGLLNARPDLSPRNPTAEALALEAFRDLGREGFQPAWVRIREKANYWALCRGAEA